MLSLFNLRIIFLHYKYTMVNGIPLKLGCLILLPANFRKNWSSLQKDAGYREHYSKNPKTYGSDF